MRRVLHRRHLLGVDPQRGPIDYCWRPLAEGFVRALLVVLPLKAQETLLLGCQILGGWPCRLRLERAVHALVTAVVLRMAGTDRHRPDPQLQPPDRES